MSVLGEYPEAKKDVQIWNNSAFDDDGDSESFNSSNQMKSPSWFMKKPVPVNLSSDSSKENQSPSGLSKSSIRVHQSKPFQTHPIKICSSKAENLQKTDEEIEIENEISRLFAKLESIRRERAENNAKYVAKQVAMDPEKKKESGGGNIQESRNKIQRRGFSLGPNEIMCATNSNSKSKSRQWGTSTQNRRKSCFWKLDDIEEEKSGFSKTNLRQAVTTVASKKGMKKDELILKSIQPKKLFGEPAAKKPIKPGRVIPSRYNQATVSSSMKKTDNDERKSRVKKKWDIPSVTFIPNRLNLDDNEDPVDVVLLPRIRVDRCVEEADRDSGPAKRVAELVGKKSYFDEEAVVCQQLSFDED